MNTLSMTEIQAQAELFVTTKSQSDFSTLFNMLREPLHIFVEKRLGSWNNNDGIVEDLVIETFMTAYSHINTYDPRFKFTTWIYTVAKNLVYHHEERYATKNVVPFSRMINEYTSEVMYGDEFDFDSMYQNETQDFFQNMTSEPADADLEKSEFDSKFTDVYTCAVEEIDNLSETLRYILYDKEIQKMNDAAIAHKYNLNLNTVKTRIKDGRTRIRKAIIAKYGISKISQI